MQVSSGVEKNLKKWLEVDPGGVPVEGTVLVPTKMFARCERHKHTADLWLEQFPKVKCVIDLSSEHDPYTISKEFVVKFKLKFTAKMIPSCLQVEEFVRAVEDFRCEFPDSWIAVHCHYGFNRTGFLIASYCCEVIKISPFEAIERFAKVRSPGIKHQHFKEELISRYIYLIPENVKSLAALINDTEDVKSDAK
jgi:protein-tyrosine phosphatase